MKPRIPVILPLLLAMRAPAAPEPAAPGNPVAVPVARVAPDTKLPLTLPFEFHQGRVVVKAMVAQEPACSAVISTGLGPCLIAPGKTTLKPLLDGPKVPVDMLDSHFNVTDLGPQPLQLGDARLTDLRCALMDVDGMMSGQIVSNAPWLWLGNQALAGFTVTIDPAKKTVTLADPNAALPKGARLADFSLVDGRMVVQVRANDTEKFDAVLDCSVSGSVIPASVATALKLKPSTAYDAAPSGGKGGKVCLAEVRSLTIGKFSQADVPVLYVAPANAGDLNKDFAVIGANVLMNYRVTIQYSTHKIAFEALPKPADKPAEPFGGKPDGKGAAPASQPARTGLPAGINGTLAPMRPIGMP